MHVMRRLGAGTLAVGLVAGLTLGAGQARGVPPPADRFIGDAKAAGVSSQSADQLRWPGRTVADPGKSIRGPGRRLAPVVFNSDSIRKIREGFAVKDQEAIRQGKTPRNRGGPQLADDLTPAEYLDFLESLTDKQRVIRPPKNKLTMVDQEKWAAMTPEERKAQQQYRTVKKIRRYRTVRPIFEVREIYWPD